MYITAVLKPDETNRADNPSAASDTTAVSGQFSDCLKDAQSETTLESIFKEASETYGVSYQLLTAMAKQESNFQADATSKSGAMGIMQLMPQTAAALGCENAYDPQQNIMAGAKYISQLLNKYDGNTAYALAAYNAGSGSVDKYGGIPPFTETQNYVAKITAYMNEGVSLPDGTVVTGATASSDTASLTMSLLQKLTSSDLKDALDKVFSQEDYLQFLKLFLDGINTALATEQKKDDTEEQTASQTVRAASTQENRQKKSFQVIFEGKPDAYYAYESLSRGNTRNIIQK